MPLRPARDSYAVVPIPVEREQGDEQAQLNMTERAPELEELPRGLVLDGELVALNEQARRTDRSCATRILHGPDGSCEL